MLSFEGWLQDLGLERYVSVFAANGVDFDTLRLLTDEDLERLGVLLGHRRKLLGALPGSAPAAPAEQPPGAEERRQLTVVFCDIVGYTALAGRLDPEPLRDIVRRYEDACAGAVARYEGYVYQRLGDAVVAFFGYPLAHEGEADRALRAGLEMVEAIPRLDLPGGVRLQVRVGIATGLVVVSQFGAAGKSAVGEAMNLAARLQGLAEPGGIVVSHGTRQLAGAQFDYQDLGEHLLKGLAQPVRPWRVLGLRAEVSRFEAATGGELTPLVGRTQEVALLLERWQLAQQGDGQAVVLSGEAGIGKSRTLRELRERIEGRRAMTLHYQCSPYHMNSAFHPVADHFHRTLQLGRDDDPGARLDKFEALVIDKWKRPLVDMMLLASLLSLPAEARHGSLGMSPQRRKEETMRALVELIVTLARERPVLMQFEDIHWADASTLELAGLLVERMGGAPLLLVVTCRPEFHLDWTGHLHVTALALSRLGRAQCAAIVTRMAGGKGLPAALMEQIVERADGVPLFLEELTKAILESGVLRDAGDHYEYARSPDAVAVPTTLRDSLMARLDRSLEIKEVAQVGACLGREFSHELLATVADMAPADLQRALDMACAAGLIFRRATEDSVTYTFKHALVRDAAYESLLKSRRQALHARIAQAIEAGKLETEPELVALHLTQAGEIERAIPLWQKAGELAFQRLAVKEAIAHLTQGLDLLATLPPSPQRAVQELKLRGALTPAWMALRGWASAEAGEALQRGLQLARTLGDPHAIIHFLSGIVTYTSTQGRIAQAAPQAAELAEVAQRSGHPNHLLLAELARGHVQFWLGSPEEVVRMADAVVKRYDVLEHRYLAAVINSDPKTLALMYRAHALWMLGYPQQALQEQARMVEHSMQRGHTLDIVFASAWGSVPFDYLRDAEALRRAAQHVDAFTREHGLAFHAMAQAGYVKALALLRAGELQDGIAQMRTVIRVREHYGTHISFPYFKCVLAEALAAAGDTDAALAAIGEAQEQAERPGWEERAHYPEILRVKGWILQQQGMHDAAVAALDASLDAARARNMKSWELRTCTTLARLLAASGERGRARELLAPAYGWFTEGFETADLRAARTMLEELG
jgi:class 3 adenylate cyclase/predicted ATPase